MATTITLFLMDDSASDRIQCTLSGWIGVAYKIPRTELTKEYLTNEAKRHLSQSGVYILFGESEDTGDDVAYIGQASVRKSGEGLLGRLQEHARNPEKDYWSEAIAITTREDIYGLTEISYLENRLYTIASEAKRYIVKNGNDPSSGHVSDAKKSELEEFIESTISAVGALGRKIFQPPREKSIAKLTKESADTQTSATVSITNEPVLHFNRKGGKKASGQRTSDGFVVFKGSMITATVQRSCPKFIRDLREKYIAKIDSIGILQEDIPFKSPSSAATFIQGSPQNGNIAWKTTEGNSLNDFARKLTDVADDSLFYFDRPNGKASGRLTSDGFVVLKGSVITPALKKSCPKHVRLIREQYASMIDNHNVLLEDVLLTSPSAAAAFVQGSSLSGNVAWKTKEGESLKVVSGNE